MRKADTPISNAFTHAFGDIFAEQAVAPQQAKAEAPDDGQRRDEEASQSQQKLVEAIGSYIEEIVKDQCFQFLCWLGEHKDEEARRFMLIEPQIRACATLLESILDHMRNPHGSHQMAADASRPGAAS